MRPLKLTVEELAMRTGYPISFIEALTRKEERASEAFAKALSREFGTTHRFWLNLQLMTLLQNKQNDERPLRRGASRRRR